MSDATPPTDEGTQPIPNLNESDLQKFGLAMERARKDAEKINAMLGEAFKDKGDGLSGDGMDQITRSTEEATKSINVLKKETGSIDGVLSSLSKKYGVGAESIKKLVDSAGGSLSEFKEKARSVGITFSADKSVEALKKSLSDAGEKSGGIFGSMFGISLKSILPQSVMEPIEQITKYLGSLDLGKTLGQGGMLAVMGAMNEYAAKMPFAKELNEAQKVFMPIQRSAQQLGISFGEIGKNLTISRSLEVATKSANDFGRGIANAGGIARVSIDEANETTKILAQSLGRAAAVEPIDPSFTDAIREGKTNFEALEGVLGSASKGIDGTTGKLTALDATLLMGKAVGMSSADTANILNTSMLELGASSSEAMKDFALMQDASSKSNLGMEKVSRSIVSSAQALKMWGGTIGSVTPLFNMFADSLGKGQKGLAPELLASFTSGLERMTLAQRAFIGVQAGMGAGAGGALGAGLEMEAAMEDKSGEGMKKIIGNLTEVLKQQGGGQVITRQQAIADPSLQAGFLMQRQLTAQMLGVSEATATKTLDALGKVQEGGLSVGEDQTNAVRELIDAGKQIGDQNTPFFEKIAQMQEQMTLSMAPEMIKKLSDVAEGTIGIMSAINSLEKFGQGSVNKGELNIDDAKKAVEGIFDNAKEKIKEMQKRGQRAEKAKLSPAEAMMGAVSEEEQRQQEVRKLAPLPKDSKIELPEGIKTREEQMREFVTKLMSDNKIKPQGDQMRELMSDNKIKPQGEQSRDLITASTQMAKEQGNDIKQVQQEMSKDIKLRAVVTLENTTIKIDLKDSMEQAVEDSTRKQHSK